jgi:hypothetical protein
VNWPSFGGFPNGRWIGTAMWGSASMVQTVMPIAAMLVLIVHRLAGMTILRERRAEGHLEMQIEMQIVLFRQC